MTETAEEFRGIHLPISGEMQVNLTYDASAGESKGEVTAVRFDMWPTWLAIARTERDGAVAARADNPGLDDPQAFGVALRAEFRHSIASICATAFTFETFANSLKHHLSVPDYTGKRRTPSRLAFTFAQAFKMSNDEGTGLRRSLKEIFNLRNEAVHPSADFSPIIRHTVYPVAVPDRFVKFRTENASAAVEICESTLRRLAAKPRGDNGDCCAWCSAAPSRIDEPL